MRRSRCSCCHIARTGSALALLAGALLALPPSARAAALTGVCPDGSIFVVQRRESIPCSGARLVEPHEIPPLRPEFLPNPYTWEVYRSGADPNNPYNLVEAARQVRALSAPPPPGDGTALAPEAPFAEGSPGAGMPVPSSLGLSEVELRDLFLIVELAQDAVPAAFLRETADGREAFTLSLAASEAFEAQLRRAHPRAGELSRAPILVWSAVAREPGSFHGTLTFTQGHLAYSPEVGDPLQFGLLQGRLGDLEAGEVALGWVALPERMDLAAPLGVYWNDRHLEVTFR
jgi:hypothetical protein